MVTNDEVQGEKQSKKLLRAEVALNTRTESMAARFLHSSP